MTFVSAVGLLLVNSKRGGSIYSCPHPHTFAVSLLVKKDET